MKIRGLQQSYGLGIDDNFDTLILVLMTLTILAAVNLLIY